MRLDEHADIIQGLAGDGPEGDHNGAAITGDWINMKLYDKVLIVMHSGELGADIDFQVEQATSDGGTEKDISGKTTTFTNGTDENSLKVMEVRAEELDTTNNYDWIRLQADDPGGASTYCDWIYLCYNASYMTGTTMPVATS